MPVQTQHQWYGLWKVRWKRCRDFLEGAEAVKRNGIFYMPKLEDQDIAEYANYLMRATFYPAASRTKDAMLGFIFRRDPVKDLTPEIEAVTQDITLEGIDIYDYSKWIVDEVLEVGRCGSLIDWNNDENRPFVAKYCAEDIINWREDRINGKMMLTMIVLVEKANSWSDYQLDSDEESDNVSIESKGIAASTQAQADRYMASEVTRYRSYFLLFDGNGNPYVQMELWQGASGVGSATGQSNKEDSNLISTAILERKGKPLDRIPFVFHGVKDLSVRPHKPPLLDVVDVNQSHFMTAADYDHALHFSACPTLFLTGFPDDIKVRVGSQTAIMCKNPAAQAKYLEFTGAGLAPLAEALDRKEAMMAALGARLLEAPKAAVEAANSIALRQSGEKSVLSQIAMSCSNSIVKVLQWIAWWQGSMDEPEDVDGLVYTLNTDFALTNLDAATLTALVAARQAGEISDEVFFENLQRGDLIDQEWTFEEEQAAKKQQAPAPAPGVNPANPNAPAKPALQPADIEDMTNQIADLQDKLENNPDSIDYDTALDELMAIQAKLGE